ncbi:MAG: hypothetical protein FWG64_05315, partial [Firmicutes bacterium]|nr:hypothetical protein [Bacillota bacterium]
MSVNMGDKIFGGFLVGGFIGLLIGAISCFNQFDSGNYAIFNQFGTLLFWVGIGAIVGSIIGIHLYNESRDSEVSIIGKLGFLGIVEWILVGLLLGFTICNGVWGNSGREGFGFGELFGFGFWSLAIGGVSGAAVGFGISYFSTLEAERIIEENRQKETEKRRIQKQKANEEKQRIAEEQRKAQQRAEQERQKQAEEQRKAQQKAEQQQWQRNQSAEINNIFHALKANPNYNVNFNFNRINQLSTEKQTNEQRGFIRQKLLERKTELNEITIDRILQRDFQNAKIGLTILSEF